MRRTLRYAALAGLTALALGLAGCTDKIVYGQSFDATLVDLLPGYREETALAHRARRVGSLARICTLRSG